MSQKEITAAAAAAATFNGENRNFTYMRVRVRAGVRFQFPCNSQIIFTTLIRPLNAGTNIQYRRMVTSADDSYSLPC